MQNYITEIISQDIEKSKKWKALGWSGDPDKIKQIEELNKEAIEKNQTPLERKESPDIIKAGTEIKIPVPLLNFESILPSSSQLADFKDYGVYFTQNQKSLQGDSSYSKGSGGVGVGGELEVDIQNLNARVWIYSKVLDEIIDVSPFIESLNTTKGFEYSSFDVSLNPFKSFDDITIYPTHQNLNGVTNIFNLMNNGKYTQDFLEKNLQYNDLVFIRFERLQLEERNVTTEGRSLVVSNQSLCNVNVDDTETYRVWDMIGLLDNVNIMTNHHRTDKNVNIVGRDLSKILTDDGSYFFPFKYMLGESGYMVFDPSQLGDKWSKRNIITGEFDQYFFNYDFKGLKDFATFIMAMLSNLGIVKDELFKPWGDRQTSFDLSSFIPEEENVEAKGVWRIVKLFVDDASKSRQIVGSMGNPEGTLQDFFNNICQFPLVEFFGDTWKDTFDFIIRQPPFNKKAIREVIGNENNYITIKNADLLSTSLSFDNRYFSWYKVNPVDGIAGDIGTISAALIPTIFVPKMAEIFGNKRLIFEDRYVRLGSNVGETGRNDLDIMINNLVDDLIYVVESNSYLPFTRRGTIVMNGDRRIKIGTFVKLDATDELFYVTEVSHSLTMSRGFIDRTTVISVERGMRKDLIVGQPTGDSYSLGGNIETVNFSYFDLLRTEEIRQKMKENVGKKVEGFYQTTTPSNFGTNDNVMDFFLKRRYNE